MTKKAKAPKEEPLYAGLRAALQAVDRQVAREMARTPAELEQHGVQKWGPFDTRIERITAFLLQEFGEQAVNLDSLVVFSQAMAKALYLIVEDLGEEGLGETRSMYCEHAAENISRDVELILQTLAQRSTLM